MAFFKVSILGQHFWSALGPAFAASSSRHQASSSRIIIRQTSSKLIKEDHTIAKQICLLKRVCVGALSGENITEANRVMIQDSRLKTQASRFIFSLKLKLTNSNSQSIETIYTLCTIYSEKVNKLYFVKRLLINKYLRRALNQIALAKLCGEALHIGS